MQNTMRNGAKLPKWQTMENAPKDGTPILVETNHEADTYFEKGSDRLTPYAVYCEGGASNFVENGFHVVIWEEEYVESEGWDSFIPDYVMPGWWFLNGSDGAIVANPIMWYPIPPKNEKETMRNAL